MPSRLPTLRQAGGLPRLLLLSLPLLLWLNWPDAGMDRDLFLELRLPRLLLSAGAGGALALAGLWLQTLFRHGLVEPGLLGVSSGAGLAAVALLVLMPTAMAWLPLASWLGAGLALLAVLGLARRYRLGGESLLLAGVALNALLAAGTQLLLILSPDTALRAGTLWFMGSFADAAPRAWQLPVLLLAACLVWGWRRADTFDLWLLGEREAGQLGLPVRRFRRQVIWASAALVAAVVASAGSIAFIGLMAPHLASRWRGCRQREALPATVLLGAWLALLADALARTLLAPLELPVGVMTALLGAPFLIALLRQGGQR